MAKKESPAPTSVRVSHAHKLLGCSRQTVYRLIKTAGFPKPRKLTPRVVIFDYQELLAWRDSKTADSK